MVVKIARRRFYKEYSIYKRERFGERVEKNPFGGNGKTPINPVESPH
jgi:hypothetical protein